ncbi:hypothetical protein H4Q32_012035 [Labeo rohita]|uniref:Hematological and neurological expressed 1 n=1 Tax=Labeo rohita TaxID=84645 RepID=A0ABQ8ML99_LABRO|nr:hypothetical protein H4Q32_012035 [Labeo rohita]
MTTTTTFQGMDPTARSSSRVLRPPGGGSNICFGTDEEKPVGSLQVCCVENHLPLSEDILPNQPTKNGEEDKTTVDSIEEPEPVQEHDDTPAPPCLSATEQPAAGVLSGRRNPPGGKSSLILG